MGSRVRLWRWSFRWFRPLQREEFRADITPAGDWRASSTRSRKMPPGRTSPPARRALWPNIFPARRHAPRSPPTLDFVESSSVTRPHRTDRAFTWKERDFDIHDATYRMEVTILGNEVGAYGEYLKVPDHLAARLRAPALAQRHRRPSTRAS
jgi:hypothetical protein